MKSDNIKKVSELKWLTEVRLSSQPLSERCPVWVRHGVVHSGPTIPHPERHPYCELSTISEGSIRVYVGGESTRRLKGYYFLAGPGLAHWFTALSYPVRYSAIYFLPSVIIDMSPTATGMQILHRFTARQSLKDRLIRPPAKLAPSFANSFEQMIKEFDAKPFGYEARLRCLLMELLVQLFRWELKKGVTFGEPTRTSSWLHVEKVLDYLREHFAEEVYARDLAQIAGVSESRLKALFQEALGMPWTRYLQGYRIHRAAAMLSEPDRTVLDVAMSVGFDTLSHFNATFRLVMGVSPRIYKSKRTAD